MSKKMKRGNRLSPLLGLLFLFAACESYQDPPLVFDPNAPAATAPVISRVEPPSSAFAGYTEVGLFGSNFSANAAENAVYFGTERAQVLRATPTELRVLPPNLVSDNLTIKVVVTNAVEIAQFTPYSLKNVSTEYGDFTDLDLVYCLALDANENMFADLRGQGASSNVFKITPEGTKTPFGTTNFPQAIEMHVGPGIELYLHRSLGNILKIGAGGGASQAFATLPSRTASFDFDENGNIFAAGNRSGIFAVNASGTPASTGKFSLWDVRSVRVFNGFVYVAALYAGTNPAIPRSGIWRAQILTSAGALGDEELVFDWANSGEYSASTFYTITFSQEGEIYVGTNYVDPILRIKTGGSSEALYRGLLHPNATHLVWGNGDFLYMNRGNTQPENRRVYRIDMGKKGAPYYGRK